jgi:hypothetical protein
MSRYRDDDWMILLSEIAQRVEISRCQHCEETGFSDFVEDVRQELGPVVAQKGQ